MWAVLIATAFVGFLIWAVAEPETAWPGSGSRASSGVLLVGLLLPAVQSAARGRPQGHGDQRPQAD